MRVALKSASNTAETSQTTATKSSGASFLDILSQGAQTGVQGTKAASSQAQQGDADAQEQSSEQDQKPAASQTGANLGAASSQVAKNANTVPANSQQNATAGSTQASLNAQGATAAQKLATLLGTIDPLSSQATIDAEASQVSQSSGKPATPAKGAKSDATNSKSDNAQTAATAGLQIVVPVQTQALPDQTIGLKNAAASLQFVDPTAAVTAQANAADGQPAIGAQSSTSTTPDANQPTADAAQAFAKNVADVAANMSPAGTLDAAKNSDATKSAGQDAAQLVSQTANQATSQAMNLAQTASEFFSAALAPNALNSQSTINKTASSNGKTPAVNFNSSSASNALASAGATNANGATSGANTAKKTTQDAANGTQASGDATQRTQGDASQANTPATARPADADASQAIAFGTVAGSHTTASTQASTGTASAAATDGTAKHTAEAGNLPESVQNAAGSPALNSARLIQTMNESEMRVGLRSSEFGDISIRTMVSQQQVQAQISVDHTELANALTGHIATTQAKIGNEFGLHASIEVSQGGASFSGQREQSSSQQDYKPFAASVQIDGAAQTVDTTTDRLPTRPLTSMIEGSRLDIRA